MLRNINKDTAGLTMIEMVLVLVIIGLITGGIMAGMELNEQAGIRRIISDFKSYKSSYDQFIKQYNAIPGDMVDATTTFEPFTGITTFNGNGNTGIDNTVAGANQGEARNAWHHLALAGLAKDKYITALVLTRLELLDAAVPTGPHVGGGYYMVNIAVNLASGAPFIQDNMSLAANKYDNSLVQTNSVFYMSFTNDGATGILTPEEARMIDSKIDDGVYGSGSASGFLGRTIVDPDLCGGTIVAGHVDRYNMEDTTRSCVMVFNLEKRSRTRP